MGKDFSSSRWHWVAPATLSTVGVVKRKKFDTHEIGHATHRSGYRLSVEHENDFESFEVRNLAIYLDLGLLEGLYRECRKRRAIQTIVKG